MTASGDSTRDTRKVFLRRLAWILCLYSVLAFATAGCILLSDFLVPGRFLAHSKSAIEFLSYFAAKLALLGFVLIAPVIATWVLVLSLNSIVDQSWRIENVFSSVECTEKWFRRFVYGLAVSVLAGALIGHLLSK